MAVAVVGTTTVSRSTAASPITFTNGANAPAGATILTLAVGVASQTADAKSVSAVTYGGVSMTKGPEIEEAQNFNYVSIWFLLNPATGPKDVVVTYTGSVALGGVTIADVSMNGSDTTTAFRVQTTNSGSGTSVSTDLAGTVAGDLVLDAVSTGTGVTTEAGGQTRQYLSNDGANQDNIGGSTKAGGGTVNMAWTVTNDVWAHCVVSVKAAAGGSVVSPRSLALLGVGA